MQLGLDQVDYLLSSTQLDDFRAGLGVDIETEVRGRRCAYFVHTTLELAPNAERSWHLVADVNQITRQLSAYQKTPGASIRTLSSS
jgi:hypothetical protein